MAYTEFAVVSGGSNLNAGTRTGNSTIPNAAADLTYTSKVVANGWDSTTGIFTVATGDPAGAGVVAGDWASVYVTAGATVATFIARVTGSSATTITVSLTVAAGTPPATDATGATTIRIGGGWAGPSTSTDFPFNFVTAAMKNVAGDTPRVNFVAATYACTTNTLLHSLAGPIIFQGYQTSYGDGATATSDTASKATFTVNSGVVPLTVSGANVMLADMIFDGNWSSGTARGLTMSGAENTALRCVVQNVGGSGFVQAAGGGMLCVECEAYRCVRGTVGTEGGFHSASSSTMIRCIAHDCDGTTAHGFVNAATTGPNTYIGCISESNSGDGWNSPCTVGSIFKNCDAYNNAGDGFDITGLAHWTFENCNAISNTGTGFKGTTTPTGTMLNCGTFGNGVAATSGLGNMLIEGAVAYSAIPYVDAPNGDFRIGLAEGRGRGRQSWTQTAPSYGGMAGLTDIGATSVGMLAGVFTLLGVGR